MHARNRIFKDRNMLIGVKPTERRSKTRRLKYHGKQLIIKPVSTYKSLVIFGDDKFMLKSEGDGNGHWGSLYYLGDGFECNLDLIIRLDPSFQWQCDHEYGDTVPVKFLDEYALFDAINCLYEFGIYKRGYV